MFCPNCGNKTQTEQSFCRDCGIEIDEISTALIKAKLKDSSEKTGWIKRIGIFVLAAFFAGSIAFSIAAIIGNPFMSIFVFMFLFLIASGLLGNLIFENYKLRNLLKRREEIRAQKFEPSGQDQFNSPKINPQLRETTFEAIPSVTENTTELIYAERLKPKTSGELL